MACNTNNLVDLVKRNVVMNSYSSSTRFLGFCYSNIGWGNKEYTNNLLSIVKLCTRKPLLLSSLNIDSDLDEHAKMYSMTKADQSCRDFLITHGIIGSEREAVDDEFHFCDSVDDMTARSLMHYQTSVGGADGHVFFVDHEVGLIIYPHDDCGIGFIATVNSQHVAKTIEILKGIQIKFKNVMSFEFC